MTTRPRYLRHLTLDTGDGVACLRRDLINGGWTPMGDSIDYGNATGTASDASCAAMLRRLLARALAGDEVALPCNQPCTITAAKTVRGRGLVVTLGPSGGSVYVAPTSLSGATLWRSIGSKDVPPPGAPWVASGVDLAEMASLIAAAWMCR